MGDSAVLVCLPPFFPFFHPTLFSEILAAAFLPPPFSIIAHQLGFVEKLPFFFFPHLYPSLHPGVLRVPGCVSPSSSSSGPSKARSWKAALGALAVTPRLAMAEGEPWQGRGHQHLQSPRFSSPMEKPGRSQSHHIPPLFITGETLTRGILHELARADWGGMGRDGMGRGRSPRGCGLLPNTPQAPSRMVYSCSSCTRQRNHQVPTPVLAVFRRPSRSRGIPQHQQEPLPWRGLQGRPQPWERAEPGCPWLRW